MPVYKYTALSESGELIRGETVSTTKEDLRTDLLAKGLLVKSILEKKSFFSLPSNRDTVKPEIFLQFSNEFLALLKAGLSIAESLSITSNRSEQLFFQRVLTSVLDDIKQGVEFSIACKKHPSVFDKLFIAAIGTGEKTGDMVTVLERYNLQLKKNILLTTNIKQALSYPIFLLIVMIAIIIILFAFVMPRFITMYSDFDAELPYPTKLLMSFVDDMYVLGPLIGVLLVILVFAMRYALSTEKGKYQLDSLFLRLPFVGHIIEKKIISYVTRTLSALLSSGMPLVASLQATSYAVTNLVFRRKLEEVIYQVTQGVGLANSMIEKKVLPATAGKMVEAGEASGSLNSMLNDIANFYDEKLEYDLSRVISLIEPILMLIMGVVIGGIIIVMYLPIFNIASAIK
jgi:type IV pilus assembly protein PilC